MFINGQELVNGFHNIFSLLAPKGNRNQYRKIRTKDLLQVVLYRA